MGINFRGADPLRHKEVRRALCAQYGFASERPLLLSVARLSQDRWSHRLIEAMIFIVAGYPQAILLLVGDGAERPKLEAMVREHHLDQNVIFAGARTDIWELFPGCDVYLSGSGQCDIGVAALQAMACARSVVTYTIAQMDQEQMICEEQGVFIQTRDAQALARATLSLLESPEQAHRLGHRARERVLQEFSLDATLIRYETLYQAYARKI
jgi:glycosyltransferase involved in cell wall biosynthesis